MKRKLPFIIIYVSALIVTVVNIVYSIKGSIFSNINDLPKGEYVSSIVSPDSKSKINLYLIDNNLGVAMRGELETDKKTVNVFWQTGIETTQAFWKNNKVVSINGVAIDVIDGGFYDCRRGVSLFQEGAIEGGEEETNE